MLEHIVCQLKYIYRRLESLFLWQSRADIIYECIKATRYLEL